MRLEDQPTFGFCEVGFHVRMLSVVRHHDSKGTAVGACASCLREREADGTPDEVWDGVERRARERVGAAALFRA